MTEQENRLLDRFALVDARKEQSIILPSDLDVEFVEKSRMVPPNATQYCPPGGTIPWDVSGSPGAYVEIELTRSRGTGGHAHNSDRTEKAVGKVEPSSFTLTGPYPQRKRVVFTAPEASGSIRQTGTFSSGSPSRIINYNGVRVTGLQRMPQVTGITFTGSTVAHPSNHWCNSIMVPKLRALAKAFSDKYGINLYVNDMSLVEGGLFDIKGD